MAKPLGLADRIRLAKKKNLSGDELEKEKQLLSDLNLHKLKVVKDAGAEKPLKNHEPSPIPKTEQTDKQTDKQTKEHLSEQMPTQTSRQSIEQSDKQLNEQTSKQTKEQTHKYTNEQTIKQSNNGTNEQTAGQTNNRANEQTEHFSPSQQTLNLSLKPHDLKVNQYQVLHYIYFNRPFVVKTLGDHLSIRYGTIRNCINALVNKSYIRKPFRVNDGVFNGSYCSVNELKCFKLFGPCNIDESAYETEQTSNWTNEQITGQTNKRIYGHTTGQMNNRANEQSSEQTIRRTNEPTIEQTDASYNSKYVSIIKNLLTIRPGGQTVWDWWQAQGCSEKKFSKWCEEFKHNYTPQKIIEEMELYHFHATDPFGKKPKIDTSYIAHFWGLLKNNDDGDPRGRPKNYRNALQREAQELEAFKLKVQEENEKIRKQNEEIKKLKLDTEFEKIMSDISVKNAELMELVENVSSNKTRNLIKETIVAEKPLKKQYLNQLRGIFLKEY